MSAWCAGCGDEYHPVERRPSVPDPTEPRFCSVACEDAYDAEAEEV